MLDNIRLLEKSVNITAEAAGTVGNLSKVTLNTENQAHSPNERHALPVLCQLLKIRN